MQIILRKSYFRRDALLINLTHKQTDQSRYLIMRISHSNIGWYF